MPIDAVDTELEESLDFAFDDDARLPHRLPDNVGTGMRASVMLHLPGLVLERADQQGRHTP